MPEATDHRRDIDGLRAISVGFVLVYHLDPKWLPGGFIGVDVFFVISGFLITGIIKDSFERNTFSLASFYRRRINRIFPSLIVVVLASLIAGYVLLNLSDFRALGRTALASLLFVSNITLWTETGYFDKEALAKPLLHLWSLGIEEQFYIFWPLVIYVSLKMGRFAAAAVCAITAVSLAISIHGADARASWAFYLLPSRFWELAVGALLVFAPDLPAKGKGKGRLQEGVGLLGAAGLLASACLIDDLLPFPGATAIAPVAASAMLIAARSAWCNRRILSARPLVSVGLISYPLYLWHWPVIVFAYRLFGDGLATRASVCLLSLAAAALTFRYVEVPIRFGLARRFAFRAPLALVGSAAAVACLAGLVVLSNGMPWRLSAFRRDFELNPYVFGPQQRLNACFLFEGTTPGNFAPECTAATSSPAGGSVLALWGDSNAAALYPGLEGLSGGDGFRVSQYTMGWCPPLIGYESHKFPTCSINNDIVSGKLADRKPEIVVLAALWPLYYEHFGVTDEQRDEALRTVLNRTLTKIRDFGARQIVLVDTAPQWRRRLPEMVSSLMVAGVRLPPERLISEKTTWDGHITAVLEEVARQQEATYFDPRAHLCDGDRCLVRLNDQASSLTTWDFNHLAPAASQLVARYLVAELQR